MMSRGVLKLFLLYGSVIALVTFSCFPLVWMVLSCLKPLHEMFSYPPDFIPKHITVSNFIRLFTTTNFVIHFKNSVSVAGYTVLLCIVMGSMGAYGFTRYKYRGRDTIATIILVTYMFAPITLVIPLFMLLTKFRLTNSHIGLVMMYMTIGLPFSVWLLRSFFLALPVEIEEAAWIDGASRIRGIVSVVLPNTIPGIIAVAVFVFIVAWSDFLYVRTIITSERLLTVPVGITNISRSIGGDWGVVLSAGTLITIPALILFIFVQKYLVSGWAVGGIK